MRARYIGDVSQVFPALGPYVVTPGDVIGLPEGIEETFLSRPDFEKVAKNAALTTLARVDDPGEEETPATEEAPDDSGDEPELEVEPEPEPEPVPDDESAAPAAPQGDDVTEEASAGN